MMSLMGFQGVLERNKSLTLHREIFSAKDIKMPKRDVRNSPKWKNPQLATSGVFLFYDQGWLRLKFFSNYLIILVSMFLSCSDRNKDFSTLLWSNEYAIRWALLRPTPGRIVNASIRFSRYFGFIIYQKGSFIPPGRFITLPILSFVSFSNLFIASLHAAIR